MLAFVGGRDRDGVVKAGIGIVVGAGREGVLERWLGGTVESEGRECVAGCGGGLR